MENLKMSEIHRKRICEMVCKIYSEERLKKIYAVVHRLFVYDRIETRCEEHITEKERLRQRINGILDELEAEKLSRIYLYLLSIAGKAV